MESLPGFDAASSLSKRTQTDRSEDLEAPVSESDAKAKQVSPEALAEKTASKDIAKGASADTLPEEALRTSLKMVEAAEEKGLPTGQSTSSLLLSALDRAPSDQDALSELRAKQHELTAKFVAVDERQKAVMQKLMDYTDGKSVGVSIDDLKDELDQIDRDIEILIKEKEELKQEEMGILLPSNKEVKADIEKAVTQITQRAESFHTYAKLTSTGTPQAPKPIQQLIADFALKEKRITDKQLILTRADAKQLVRDAFDMIATHKPDPVHVEKILDFLQTNPATADVIQSKKDLHSTLQMHLKDLKNTLYKSNNLGFIKHQTDLLQKATFSNPTNPPKFTIKDDVVYVTPAKKYTIPQIGGVDLVSKKTIEMFTRKGVSQEAGDSVRTILAAMDEAISSLPDSSEEAQKEAIKNLQSLANFLTSGNEWMGATIERHSLQESVNANLAAVNGLKPPKPKAAITKENLVSQLLEAADNPQNLNALLHSFRNFMTTEELLNGLRDELSRKPGNLELKQAIHAILKNWIVDNYVNQNEWRVVNNHPIMKLLPLANDSDRELNWEDLRHVFSFKARGEVSGIKSAPTSDVERNKLFIEYINNPEFRQFVQAVRNASTSAPVGSEVMSEFDKLVSDVASEMSELTKTNYDLLQASEFNNVAWTKKDKMTTSPNVMNIIQTFNDKGTWAISLILSQPGDKERVKTIEFLIALAQKHRENGDYDSMMAILSSLGNTAVARLTESFDKISPQYKDKLAELLLTSNNQVALRNEIAGRKQAIPYLGAYLTNFVYFEDDRYKGKGNYATLYNDNLLVVMRAVDFTAPKRTGSQTAPAALNKLVARAPIDATQNDVFFLEVSERIQPRKATLQQSQPPKT